MTKVEQTLVYLYEARKSYKNHISKTLREEVDKVVKLEPYLDRKGIKTTNQLIEYIEDEFRKHNPQILLKYVGWVLKIFSFNTNSSTLIVIRLDETIQLLLKYHRLFKKKLINDLDSYNIKWFREFKDLINNIPDPRDENEYYGRREAKLVFEDNKMKLVKVETFEACVFFSGGSRGRSTPWCITGDKNDWDEYTNKMNANWYILLIKSYGEKYAIDQKTGIAYDEENNELEFDELAHDYPIIRKHIKTEYNAIFDKLEDAIYDYLKNEIEIDHKDIEFHRIVNGWDSISLTVMIHNSSNLNLVKLNIEKIEKEIDAISGVNDLNLYDFNFDPDLNMGEIRLSFET